MVAVAVAVVAKSKGSYREKVTQHPRALEVHMIIFVSYSHIFSI
jgi:hypothetical protein